LVKICAKIVRHSLSVIFQPDIKRLVVLEYPTMDALRGLDNNLDSAPYMAPHLSISKSSGVIVDRTTPTANFVLARPPPGGAAASRILQTSHKPCALGAPPMHARRE